MVYLPCVPRRGNGHNNNNEKCGQPLVSITAVATDRPLSFACFHVTTPLHEKAELSFPQLDPGWSLLLAISESTEIAG